VVPLRGDFMETISELIDKLITSNVKVWHYMEKNDVESFEKMKVIDKQRHQLMEEIDNRLGEKNIHRGLKNY
jgi:predicted RecB family endonuclease